MSHLNVPILAGIVVLKNAGMARYMNANVAGVTVPDELIKRMSDGRRGRISGEGRGREGRQRRWRRASRSPRN